MDTPMLANQQKLNIHQLCANTGYRLEGLLGVMVNRDGRQERFTQICAVNTS